MAKTWPPTLTVSAGMMVRVSGTRMQSRTPWLGLESTSTTPPIRSILARTTSMPTPRPEMAVTSSAVERLGMKTRAVFCAGGHAVGLLGRDEAGGPRLADQSFAVDAAAVVGDLDQYLVAGLAGGDPERAGGLLAGLGAQLGRLDAVVDRVADDMGERIADHLDHLAVELDVAAVGFEPDLLAEVGGEVADHARQAREEAVDALHPGAGDAVADLGDAGGDPLERGLDRDVARRVAEAAGKLVAGEHGVRDAVHHPVEQVDGEADAAHRLARLGPGRGDRLGDRGRIRLPRQRGDQLLVILARQRFAGLERQRELADAVDHREHGVDHAGVGLARPRPDLGQRPFGGVAQQFEPRQIEEAAIALDGVDEAENLVEPLAVARMRLPGDDRARQGLQHVARLGDEVVEEFVHGEELMGKRW